MKYIAISQPGGPEVLQIREGEIPTIGEHEVLIEVKAAGVNRPDILQRQGLYPMPEGVTPVPGLEVAGVVVKVGAQVAAFAPGDRVCALTNGGGYAEYCAVPAGQTLPIPAGLSFSEAAAIPETFFTVWANVFQLGKLQPGESILIHGGASGIGTTAILLCHALGMTVYATVGQDEKIAALRPYATAINYKTEDFAEKIHQLTNDEGVDVILDIVGGPYFNRNLGLLKKDGRLVIIGFMGGRMAHEVDIQTLMLKRATVTGSTMRGRTAAEKQEIAEALRRHVWPLLEAGKCKPMIYASYPMAEIAEAHACLDSGQHLGKVVITMTS
ncbi:MULTISPECIES: NAD(P)H-quinone oxidoreductase [Klebsiella]|uniref:NAD(P)H-quinone oxidoreductase n=1 Tax=Klebsiella TaxID=570 RepID=UPI0003BF4D4E|nr:MULTISPECIES: NAD(P)H-quinone oxidoreductase [Klebsiella]AVO77820.1 NAD(P)H-quinone oxidoreductase [Klebsiella pneumoniae]AVR38183.1 Quinone oxidoreductase PIG3 [Klebsiella quasipneumoniae]EIY4986335.1 NAD(P)H-quinone oxidoreductase [Klebsiella quasipneumoniae]EIY4992477.1 NAD(P)H-quinone oxidoreductase [Klebsiella quasipneumoniae]EIY5020559.1 NAD(P)H-quinone oxidoreductase [Klebsiella quasipneumoniae]